MLSVKCQSEEFSIYLNYVRKLGFEETPDYDFLRALFTKILHDTETSHDGVYDWAHIDGVARMVRMSASLAT